MIRTRIRLDELVIRGVPGVAPSPAEIEQAVHDALARELAGTMAAKPGRIDHLHMRMDAGARLADAAGATARGIAGSIHGKKP